jgi:fructoselysine-6-P-deglycase FrlB-like protein
VNPELFRRDLECKPEVLAALADELRREDPWAGSGISRESRIVLLGMGSSHYANGVAAARLRARGVSAVAELASSDLLPPAGPGVVVVAVSASGGSAETLDAVGRYEGRCPVIALTNVEESAIASRATGIVRMQAQAELGGVACRSFQHTVALLLALERSLLGGPDIAALVTAAAEASADLLDRREEWLPRALECAVGPDDTHFVAPARRFASAQQSALMLREGPRLPAVACETGDWSHVDVYLTKTTDYRLVLFGGSRWEPELLTWVRERGSTLMAVGADVPAAAQTIRYRHDDDDDARLLAEVLVAELLASRLWA